MPKKIYYVCQLKPYPVIAGFAFSRKAAEFMAHILGSYQGKPTRIVMFTLEELAELCLTSI